MLPLFRRVNAFPYILSKIIATDADHKPLVPLLSTTFQSASLPSSTDEIWLFHYLCPWEATLYNRYPFPHPSDHTEEDVRHSTVTEAHVAAILSQLPASEDCLDVSHKAQRIPHVSSSHSAHVPLPFFLPNPWEKIATDLFKCRGQHYSLFAHYVSRYPEIIVLPSSSESVISAKKSVFSRHGIPSTIASDNGPQYNSPGMKALASSYGYKHITSCSHYSQSNGQADRTVKTAEACSRIP